MKWVTNVSAESGAKECTLRFSYVKVNAGYKPAELLTHESPFGRLARECALRFCYVKVNAGYKPAELLTHESPFGRLPREEENNG